MNFLIAQSRMDLLSAARSIGGKAEAFSEPVLRSLIGRLRIRDNEIPADWKLEATDKELDAISLAACSPEEGADQFLFATCLSILCRFEKPNGTTDFEWEWDAFASDYRAAPAPVRAAIMNGLRALKPFWLVHENIGLTKEDCQSLDVGPVMDDLASIARRLSPEQISTIATFDYGKDVDKHASKLTEALKRKHCLFERDETWYPAEVVELASYAHPSDIFAPCTALVLLNAIADGDGSSHAEFRWETLYEAYRRLPHSDYVTITNGFRLLYESLEGWEPLGRRQVLRNSADSYLPWLAVEAS